MLNCRQIRCIMDLYNLKRKRGYILCQDPEEEQEVAVVAADLVAVSAAEAVEAALAEDLAAVAADSADIITTDLIITDRVITVDFGDPDATTAAVAALAD